MPFVPQHPKLRHALPVPDRKRGLWRGCVFAINPRHTYGAKVDGYMSGFDSVNRQFGRIVGGGIVSDLMFHNSVLGWAYRSGTLFDRYIAWDEIDGRRRLDLSPDVTIAILFRFVGAVPAADRVLLSKRWFNAATRLGIALNLTAAGLFSMSWSDGVNEQVLLSTSGADSQFTRLIIGRRTNAMADIWLNGVRENFVAAPLVVGNELARAVRILADSVTTPINGQVAFAGLWKRAITQQEIALLHSDPWVMWRPATSPLGLPYGSGIINGCHCGGPWLHAWSGLG